MQTITDPKAQARLLKAFLQEKGLSLAHQDSLEAVARMAGLKNWKTLSAKAPEPKPGISPLVAQSAHPSSVPPVTPEPLDGKMYSVPVTVDVTMTGTFNVLAHSADEAMAAACELGHTQYPTGFELDEGNYRGGCDFYCADSDAVTATPCAVLAPEIASLTSADFDELSVQVANNMGMHGEFSVQSGDEQYLLYAMLESIEPDSSDDNRRSKCTLTIKLVYSEHSEEEGTVIVAKSMPYAFGGDDRARGDHLEELFFDEELLPMLLSPGNRKKN